MQIPGAAFLDINNNQSKKGDQMNAEEIKYQNAKKRVAAIKGYYTHLIVYIVVNLMLFAINMLSSPASLWFYWPLFGWGIAIVIHTLSVFSSGFGLGADWEQRKIQELMEEE
jgi:hypothetical protein